MNSNEIAIKRSILLSAKMQFSPETQPIKETAIDKIVEQNLLIADSDEGVTMEEIEQKSGICFGGGLPAIRSQDLQRSLKRLSQAGRVMPKVDQDRVRYRLSEQAMKDLREIQQTVENRLDKVVNRLFRDAKEGPSVYKQPFVEILCVIFSRLGETYVRILKGEVDLDEILSSPSVERALREISLIYTNLNHSFFKAAVFSFFKEIDPDYDAIKWNMTQNYFVVKALGLDPSGYLLSKDFFGKANFYLDTNVIINALEPKAQYHRSFKALSGACKQLQIMLNACQITLDELRRVVANRKDVIAKVAEQIPEDTASKVQGIFYQLYHEELESKGRVNLDEIFASFENPSKDLSELYEVSLIDDMWFTDEESQPQTMKLRDEIRAKYREKKGRSKGKMAALHDALMIRWILTEREKSGKNPLLVTLDTTLPGLFPAKRDNNVRPLAITLDTLLQWISPIGIHGEIEDEIAVIFSEVVKYQLLPQESFFRLTDFLVFAELEMSCKELPAEDVEKCIQYLRTNAPSLDLSNPRDREKLAHETSRFFVDLGRKYKQDLLRLESEVEKMKKEIEKRDNKIERLKKEKLKRSAYFRLGVVISIFIVFEIVAFYLANRFGGGTNFFQRLGDLWYLPASGLGIVGFLFYFILGKEKISVLSWSIKKLFSKQ